jgi:hypothetical protein
MLNINNNLTTATNTVVTNKVDITTPPEIFINIEADIVKTKNNYKDNNFLVFRNGIEQFKDKGFVREPNNIFRFFPPIEIDEVITFYSLV